MIDTSLRTTCKLCGNPIAQTGRGPKPRLYCSDACKQKAFRERQRDKQQTDLEYQSVEVYQQKLIEAQQRMSKLERQVEIQRQRLGEYYQLVHTAQQSSAEEVEQEVQKLSARLNLEERFRTDVQVRHFKRWLRTHDQPQDSDFAKRFLADTRLPQHASRARYEAMMRLYSYSQEDLYLFQDAWKTMLFQA